VTEIPQLRCAALGTFAAEGVESQPNHYNCKQHPLVFRPEPPDGMQQPLSGSGRIISRPDTSTLEGRRIFKYLRWYLVCLMDPRPTLLNRLSSLWPSGFPSRDGGFE
jgi:hypothetical protein